ncbi:MAG: hypothetical protein IK019_03120, partial [Clostridia bacterium]|nr:hypothetical protein [Clostridia bacterium]
EVQADGVVNLKVAREGLKLQEVDDLGLDRTDRNMLTVMITKFGGGPVGLETLAATTGEDAGTIEDVYEPYLMQLGFIMRTPRGCVCTALAYRHMGFTPPQTASEDSQMKLDL